ncbi:MAG: FGGY family carbohydrate kinase [Bacteroidales bacterium]|jgi:sugar (pentulose or hexulose) kinase|nr:FGGY family carbohydrate kinase [Bacteroidales bacterium]
MKEKVIAVFDVGKTNKKIVLFNQNLELIEEAEEKFPEIMDDEGFPCDNIELIENWIKDSVERMAVSSKYELTAVNFATYGATLAYLNESGSRITPIYNYLKPLDEKIPERLYRRYGGQDEFCRRTASPALGMLNSGIQILRLKITRPDTFSRVTNILHFPQYLSYRLTGKMFSEHTSIGCHTALWDFDNMEYHPWLKNEQIILPEPVTVETTEDISIRGKKIKAGIGLHDSSASLAPYFSGNRGKFLLVSTGTWCINMNPFNSERLTTEQLDRDCLCYMSVTKQPVKSSRLFLGNMHETGVKMIDDHFRTSTDYFRKIKYDSEMAEMLRKRYSGDRRAFFKSGPESREFKDRIDLYDFRSFEEAYHQLMMELGDLAIEAIKLVIPENDDIENIYITGGFSKNSIFRKLVSAAFPTKRVYTSVINNGTALGAALVTLYSINQIRLSPDLGLTEC